MRLKYRGDKVLFESENWLIVHSEGWGHQKWLIHLCKNEKMPTKNWINYSLRVPNKCCACAVKPPTVIQTIWALIDREDLIDG